MEEEKRNRSTYVGIYTTPELAKQLEDVKNNQRLQEKILKQFVESETNWLKEEIQNIDEITTIYRAKLVYIKDGFSKAKDIYVEEIEKLSNEISDAFEPLKKKFAILREQFDSSRECFKYLESTAKHFSEQIGYFGIEKVERLFDLVDRYNQMNGEEKEFLKMFITEKK
jgi:hypothetical protein